MRTPRSGVDIREWVRECVRRGEFMLFSGRTRAPRPVHVHKQATACAFASAQLRSARVYPVLVSQGWLFVHTCSSTYDHATDTSVARPPNALTALIHATFDADEREPMPRIFYGSVLFVPHCRVGKDWVVEPIRPSHRRSPRHHDCVR